MHSKKRRDDFASSIVNVLARRVGMRCSNPNCRMLTTGPRSDPDKAINIGVAAHITAAAPGGPRYDAALSPADRSSAENGIWLCQNHAKVVDNDTVTFPADLLREWKRCSEQAASLEVTGVSSTRSRDVSHDTALIRFFVQCFDRPAFQDPYRSEGSTEALDQAFADTLTAINTGCLRSRGGAILAKARGGKAFLVNRAWRLRMDEVTDLLRALRSRYEAARQDGLVHIQAYGNGSEFYDFRDHSLANWMDQTRVEVLRVFSTVCSEAAIEPPIFPRPRRGHWQPRDEL